MWVAAHVCPRHWRYRQLPIVMLDLDPERVTTMRALGLVVMLTLIPSVASAGSGWAVKCPYSHSNNDDPIKFPRQQGATHLHDFYGSMTTNYLSTYSSMRASPSTCGTAGDTSGYWAPALYRNGVRVFPQGSF